MICHNCTSTLPGRCSSERDCRKFKVSRVPRTSWPETKRSLANAGQAHLPVCLACNCRRSLATAVPAASVATAVHFHALGAGGRGWEGSRNAFNVEASPKPAIHAGTSVGVRSMHNSSHATSKLSSQPRLIVASRCASTGSEYLPSTSLHDAHAHFFVIHPLLYSMMRTLSLFWSYTLASFHGAHTYSCTGPAQTFLNAQPLPLQLRLMWRVVLRCLPRTGRRTFMVHQQSLLMSGVL